jgi:hypothetical protein
MTFFWLNVSPIPFLIAQIRLTYPVDGFFLEKNESDCVYLDDIIFRDITSADKREELALNQYYG